MSDDDRKHLLVREEIISALLAAVEQLPKLISVCSAAAGTHDDTRQAVVEAFGVGDAGAEAILQMQVRRFTPASVQQLRDDLADVRSALDNI